VINNQLLNKHKTAEFAGYLCRYCKYDHAGNIQHVVGRSFVLCSLSVFSVCVCF